VEKKCFACLETKPLSDFYKHPKMADGHLGKCKECQKSASIKNRLDNVERYREYDRARGKLPHRVASAIAQSKKWRAEDSRRARCHNAVAKALKSGKLQPEPCTVCGSENAVAHHTSYDHPLDVVWVCQVHHKELHRRMNNEN
jgi:hypothetical protein